MALSSTIYVLTVDLADADRSVYETLELRVAMHPSEAPEYLWTRVLAYCLEYAEGIAFSKGLADRDEPTLSIRDLTGALTLWVEIGTPSAERVHQASKASPRVAVYCHKDADLLASKLREGKIHRADTIELYALDREFIAQLAKRLDRRMAVNLTVSERHLYLAIGEESFDSDLHRLPIS